MSDRPMPSSFDGNPEFNKESGLQKITKKLKKEPLIPFGCLLTVAAFASAYRAMRRGDHNQVQKMFRARVAAQAFTVVCIVGGGLYYAEDRNKTKEIWKAQALKEEEEKRDKWIKELEARDAEDKALKERLDRRRQKAADRGSASAVTEAVAAQARAAFKSDKDARDVAEIEVRDQAASVEEKEGSGVLDTLGGWIGGSKKAPGDKPLAQEGAKDDADLSEK
ncbi:hypoxia induced protein conserved region-domain-containing protein [Podospora didyma]|uniref:Hypoxia induced protein conserved region-domain-containing protein n=1 Tax=Podospora didyma TaxID=330526 RepID=A0AAE0K151_9PEZI|nr:hypoxia induced protein conserved region-domain-containing protein [Podospora didyma]